MRELELVTFEAFREELKTAALSPVLHGAMGGAGALGGIGAAAGGLIGGVRAYRQAREQGQGTGEALSNSISSVGHGALVGGAAGAAAGGLAGHFAHGLGDKLTHTPGLGAPARFGQRQMHAVTGWEPHGGIESIRGGAWQAKQNVESARHAVGTAEHAAEMAQAGQDAKLTSIPGYVKALRQDPKGTVTKGLKEQWHGSSPAIKALTVGLPAAEALHAAAGEESPDGPGKGERIGRGLLPAAVGMASGQLPFAGQLLVGGAAGAIGAGAGRAVDRLRGRKAAPPHKDEPLTGPTEVRATPSAMMGPTGGGEGSS